MMVNTRNKSKYNSVVTQVRDFPGTTETTLQISRSSKSKQLDVDEVRTILANMQTSLGSGTKLMVRAMNAQRLFTFKTFANDDLQIEDFEDYYANKVIDTEKFEKFSFIQVTSLVTKPKKVIKKKKANVKTKKL
jgi:hypothetical protein